MKKTETDSNKVSIILAALNGKTKIASCEFSMLYERYLLK
jgi:hypothetical protein